MSTISERVQRGAALLDARLPGWWKTLDIDPARFNMGAGCQCVIGQLYPATGFEIDEEESESPFEHAIDHGWLDLDERAAVECGFYATLPHGFGTATEYDALTSEWVRVITERRAAA